MTRWTRRWRALPFRMVSTPHPMSKKGFPLDRLSIDLQTGKYYYDLNEQEAALDQLAVEDGFLQFFERVNGGIQQNGTI